MQDNVPAAYCIFSSSYTRTVTAHITPSMVGFGCLAMELLLLLPSRAAASSSRPLLPTRPLRRASATTTFRSPASSSSNAEVTGTTATTTSDGGVAKSRPEWRRAGGQEPFGLGLDLSEEMRCEMMWRMMALPAAAVAAEAVFLRLLDGAAVDAPAWAGAAGSAVLFAAGLVGSQYGFLSSRWDAAETGSVVGWELAVQHWKALPMANDSSMEEDDNDDDEYEEYEEDSEGDYEEDD